MKVMQPSAAADGEEQGFPRFEELDHTADLCIRAYGSDLKELFECAARGMFALMQSEPGEGGEQVSHHILLQSDDVEALLVDWLNELLYLGEAEQELYDVYDMSHLGERSLEATVSGETNHPPLRGIKAATFFDLHVTRNSSGYQATITFDV
ncbi:MAG: archease [Anaerolineales bacterium]|nr:MAG: archease [Anaerolineales bacterium]